MKQFDIFLGKKNALDILDDRIHTDCATLDIHTSKFTNVTLVRVAWFHVHMDATGPKDLFGGGPRFCTAARTKPPGFMGLARILLCVGG